MTSSAVNEVLNGIVRNNHKDVYIAESVVFAPSNRPLDPCSTNTLVLSDDLINSSE